MKGIVVERTCAKDMIQYSHQILILFQLSAK